MSHRWAMAALPAVLLAALAAASPAPTAATPSALGTPSPPTFAPAATRPPLPSPAAGTVLHATLSPVLVPPGAPADVTVSSEVPAEFEVALETHNGEGWLRLETKTLSKAGLATFRIDGRGAGTYEFRVVAAAVPPPAVTSEPLRLVVTRTGVGDPKAYRYLKVIGGVPARWNPCATVTYRVNAAAVPRSTLADLEEALRRVSYETGLRFEDDGTTAQVPGGKGFRYDADVVIAFVPASRSKHLKRGAGGVAGLDEIVRGRGGRPRAVHGFMVFDAAALEGLPSGFGEGRTVGQVLLHEVGHLVGLGHVRAAHQVMRPETHTMAATLYGAGDLTGLRSLGIRAGCV